MDLKKQVTYLNIKELTPYKRNPRKNDKAVDKLSDAIGKNSFRGAIIVWENSEEIIGEKNIILAGNTRYKALKKMGEKEVPVILERFENEEEAFNFCITDNKSNEWAEWDFGKLEEELKSLNFLEEDLKDLEEEFKMDFSEPKSEEELNSVPEVKKEAYSQVGDLFLIDNRHRVLCGDSTKKEDVTLLMDGKKSDMVFTDLPYNVDYEGYIEEKLKIDSDKMKKEDYESFLYLVFKNYFDFTVNEASFYICHADAWQMITEQILNSIGIVMRNQIIWGKNTFAWGFGRYKFRHEPILYCHKEGFSDNWYGDKTQNTLWEEDKPSVNKEHPTMKPIGLVNRALINSSLKDNTILDLFLGSGTTLIACEQTGRVCYGMELEPLYIDVILRRYHKLYPDKEIKCLNREFNFEVLYG
jgi:DNA modification methylase